MGRKKRKQKQVAEEVIVIDLNDDDNPSGENKVDQRDLQQKSDKKKKNEMSNGKKSKLDKDKSDDENGDCIDLTEQDKEHRESDKGSEDIVIIEDDEAESDRSRKRKLPAYAVFRQGLGFTAENLRAEARGEVGHKKAAKKNKKKSFKKDEEILENEKESRGKQRSPRRQDSRNRLGQSHSSPDRSRTTEYRKDLRQSPRKHNRDINYTESSSPDTPAKDSRNTSQSPKKRKRNRSRKRDERSNDRRSRSPLNEDRLRGEGNDNLESRSSMHFEVSQQRWKKAPRNQEVMPESSSKSADTYCCRDKIENRGENGINMASAVINGDSTDGNIVTAKSLSAFVVALQSSALLVLPHPSCFILKGKARVQPLVGSACIMGYVMKDSTKTYDVYSPECISLITMETVTGEQNKDVILEAVSSHFINSEDNQMFQNKLQEYDNLIVLKISKLDSALCDYVTTLTEFQNLFSMGGNKGEVNKVLSPFGVSVFQNTWQPHVTVTSELQQAIDDWTESLNEESKVPPCMMVVGGKDSGKSTTNRLLINNSFNSVGGIYFLECDVGQTEFTPPGCVSLQYITEPVFGPPFTHQKKPICSYYFGGITPQDDPSMYIECVERCVQRYHQLEEPGPLIVNTMGWVKGLGLQLLIDTLRLVSPSHVIQLWCRQKHHNCDRIDGQFHLRTSWLDLAKENYRLDQDQSKDHLQSTRREHKLMIVDSISKSDGVNLSGLTVRLRPVDFRDLSLLSHLYSDLDSHMTLTSRAPYVIPWNHVAVHVCYMPVPRDQIMYSLNAGIVALCHTDLEQAERSAEDSPMFFNSMPICEWIGFGMVRGVDPVKKELYIVTSVDLAQLKYVNTLLKGSVTLPEQLIKNQHCHGDRLYVDDEVKSLGLATVKPRKHMPRQRLQVNNGTGQSPARS